MVTTRILGLPGTGKTTNIVTMIRDMVTVQGYEIDDICMNTFLRKMAEEAKMRIRNELSLDENYGFKWITTTHGICRRLLEDEYSVADRNHIDDFCKKMGYVIDSRFDPANPQDFTKTLGSKLFAMKSYLVQNMLDRNKWDTFDFGEHFGDVSRSDIDRFLDSWESYKKDRAIMDFDDMLEIVFRKRLVPPVKVLFWDEYQDVSLLQHLIAKMWAASIEKTIIAGDHNQVLYTWAGADPKFFKDWNANEIVLHNSFRLRRNIWDFVRRNYPFALPEISVRDGGKIEVLSYNSFKPLTEKIRSLDLSKSVKILCRANYMCDDMARKLQEEGVPAVSRRYRWGEREIAVYNGLWKILRSKPLSSAEIARLVEVTSNSAFTISKNKLADKELDQREFFNCLLHEPKEYVKKLLSSELAVGSKLSNSSRDKISNLLVKWNMEFSPIEVTTMHQMKGGEADIVFVCNSVTPRIDRAMSDGDPSEHFVFFVGFTRAREELYVLDGLFGDLKYEVTS